jgi:uncharacterized coiled-coil DUF342 family protein
MNNFLNETSVLCNNYEKEIDTLAKKLEDKKTFNNLEITHLEFESYSPLVAFNKQIENLINNGSGIEEITMAYNDKITELFLESEGFVNKLKDSENEVIKLKDELEKALRTIEDRDITLQTINGKLLVDLDSYQEKLKEIFEETEHVQNELDSYKKNFWDKESECFKLIEEKASQFEEMEKAKNEIVEVMKNEANVLENKFSALKVEKEECNKEIKKLNLIIQEKGKI